MQWNGGEKFGRYISWLHFLLDHFLLPWGYLLNGRVTWQGDNQGDTGIIVVMNNEVTTEARPHQEEEKDEDNALLEWDRSPSPQPQEFGSHWWEQLP
jgi:hypothetical protein